MNMVLAGLVVLVIGDSHMAGKEYLLTNLHDNLMSQGAIVHSYGMCGATAGDWLYPSTVSCGRGEHHESAAAIVDFKPAPTWNISDLIAKHHPNLVIIESADAMAGYGSAELPRPWIFDQVRALTGRIKASNISCTWVGPIWGREGPPYNKTATRVKEMSDFLATSVSPCAYIDSTAFSRPGEWQTTDGQHLTQPGYRLWGKDIAEAISRGKTQVASR